MCLRLGLDPWTKIAGELFVLEPDIQMDQPFSYLTADSGPQALQLWWHLWQQISQTIKNPEEKGKLRIGLKTSNACM